MVRRAMQVAALLLVAAGCAPSEEVELASESESIDRPECPHTWHWQELAAALDRELVVRDSTLSVPGEIQNVPEFHDCQRFMVVEPGSDQLRYDSLFAIFAWSRLSELGAELEESISGGVSDAIAAAEIYAENDYGPLGIEDGFNCLYLWVAQGSWSARMVPYGYVEADCTTPVRADTLRGTDLEVRPGDLGVFAAGNHVPPVARWDWDRDNRQHYIGLHCGATWCEVGPTGFVGSEPRSDLSNQAADLVSRRVFEIKGWYDEQRLATLSFVGGLPTPTEVVGAIIPAPRLDAWTEADNPFQEEWGLGARVALDGTDTTVLARYKQKFNFDPTGGFDPMDPGQRLNEIYLCTGDRSACGVEGNVDTSKCAESVGTWWAKIVAAGDTSDVRYKCVVRRPMDVEMPGTARWRWLADDEGGWIECMSGCCEVH